MKPISPFGLPIGITITFWSIIGLIRFISEKLQKIQKGDESTGTRLAASDIAVLLAAHNEELVIRGAIQALKASLKAEQIYVCSDGSTDKTYAYARMEGCHVSNLLPGIGKAKALVYLLEHYKLFEHYKLIFIVDADTKIDKDAVKRALPFFDDPKIGVVFATSKIVWPDHFFLRWSFYYIAYRDRLNRILQYCMIYGQTWKYTSVNYVIPGFATIYRSSILRQLEIDTPGLLIEDFNLAFQFHKKKLGRLGFAHSIIGWDQYPDNFADYWKQVSRWNIGFFQTIRRNGIWPSFFWLALGVFSVEVFAQSIMILYLPFVILHHVLLFIPSTQQYMMGLENFIPFSWLSLGDILIGVFLLDYLFTVAFGLVQKRPQYIFYGLFFFFMHYIVSLILLSSIIPGFFSSSSGRWTSPKRLSL